MQLLSSTVPMVFQGRKAPRKGKGKGGRGVWTVSTGGWVIVPKQGEGRCWIASQHCCIALEAAALAVGWPAKAKGMTGRPQPMDPTSE